MPCCSKPHMPYTFFLRLLESSDSFVWISVCSSHKAQGFRRLGMKRRVVWTAFTRLLLHDTLAEVKAGIWQSFLFTFHSHPYCFPLLSDKSDELDERKQHTSDDGPMTRINISQMAGIETFLLHLKYWSFKSCIIFRSSCEIVLESSAETQLWILIWKLDTSVPYSSFWRWF